MLKNSHQFCWRNTINIIVLFSGFIVLLGASGTFVYSQFSAASTSIGVSVVSSSTPPAVQTVSAVNTDGTYGSGDVITITIQFTQTVYVGTGSGIPYINLNAGGSGSYISGNASTTLHFRYVIQEGYETDDLDYTSTGALILRGGTIQNAAGTDADIELLIPGEAGSLGANKNIVISQDQGEQSSSSSSSSLGQSISSIQDTEGGGGRRGAEQAIRTALVERQVSYQSSPELCPITFAEEVYEDTAQHHWFYTPVEYFLCRGFLDASKRQFLPGEYAIRAEVAKLLVLLKGIPTTLEHSSAFRDVDIKDWFAEYIYSAAEAEWFTGYGNCYGYEECFVRPHSFITRAEAAAVIVRTFDLNKNDLLKSPRKFVDVPSSAWYFHDVSIAASHCIFQGDEETEAFRPDEPINRAELVTVLYRLIEGNENNSEECSRESLLPEHIEYSNGGLHYAATSSYSSRGHSSVSSSLHHDTPFACVDCSLCGSGRWNLCDAKECAQMNGCIFAPEIFFFGECTPAKECKEYINNKRNR